MNIRQLCSHIAEREDLKSKVRIGDVREIVGIVSDAIAASEQVADTLRENGRRRAQRRASAARKANR